MTNKRLYILASGGAALLFVNGCSTINDAMRAERVAATIAEAERQEDIGNINEAHKFYDSAISLAPNSPMPYVGSPDDQNPGVIGSLKMRSDWPTLLYYASSAVKNPDLAGTWQIWDGLALAQQRLGMAADSKASYQKVLDVMSGATLVKGEILPKATATDSAVKRADAEWWVGNRVQARTDLLEIIKTDSDDSDVLNAENELAYLEADAGQNLPEAYAFANKCVVALRSNGQTGVGFGEFLDTLAWTEHKQGKDDQAMRDAAEALDNDPREPILHMHLAEIDKALGDTQSADIEIQRAVALCPEDYEIQAAAKDIAPHGLAGIPA